MNLTCAMLYNVTLFTITGAPFEHVMATYGQLMLDLLLLLCYAHWTWRPCEGSRC